MRRWAVLVAGFAVTGCNCGDPLGSTKFACRADLDCMPGQACIAGECDVPGGDGGRLDGGLPDGGNRDGGGVDAGTKDAGQSDGGTGDAGHGDAGPGDAGTTDAGTNDAGRVDAGPADAGPADAGPVDAGSTDAGIPTLVQVGTGGRGGAKDLNIDLPDNVKPGDALIACISFDTTITGVIGIDGGGVSWVQAASGFGAVRRTAVWYGLASSGGAGTGNVAINFGGADDAIAAAISEWSNVASSGAFEGAAAASAVNNSGPVTTGALTTLNPTDLLFACAAQDAKLANGGPSAGFVALPSTDAGNNHEEEAYQVVSTAGTYQTSWTIPASTQEWCAILAGFKAGP